MSKLNEMETKYVEMMKAETFPNEDLIELSHDIESMVNNFGFHEDAVLQDLLCDDTGKKNLMELSVRWISYWGKQPEYRFDGRNEVAGHICREIVGFESFEDLSSDIGDNFTDLIETRHKYGSLATMHRTLMQTFSGFVFHAIHLIDNENARRIDEQMTDLHDEYWYCCPFV